MPERQNELGRVLVTGAGGFIGGTAMEHLMAAGEDVVGTDLNVDHELAKKLNLRRLDITQKEETRHFILETLPQTILHYAGIAMPKEVAKNEELGRRVNIDAVMNLLDAIVEARKIDPKYNPTIIVAGSVEQFGDPVSEDEVITEESPRNPKTPYGRQKQEMAERFLEKCHEENIRGYVVIQGQVSGVSPSGEISQKTGFITPDLSSQIAEHEKSGKKQGTIVTGVLNNQRPILDVNDAIRAHLELARKFPIPGEYIVCAEKSRPLKNILDVLRENSLIEISHEINKSLGAGGPDRFYSPNKIMKATDWKPEVEYETMIKRVLDYQRRYGKKTR